MIYEPRGKAREYSPLAVNLYTGCGHQCSYCYVPRVLHMDRYDFDNNPKARERSIEQLIKSAKKFTGTKNQVLMSFTTDPYNPLNDKLQLTIEALKIFLNYKIPVAILTKSGLKPLKDLSIIKLFGKHIKVGASLTYDNDNDSKRIERGAALPSERLEMLKQFHLNGVRTWVSFEPIMHIEQTINLIERSIEFVDEYQFGKLSGDTQQRDWKSFFNRIVPMLRINNKQFYIKKTLQSEAPKGLLNEQEIDMDYLNVPSFQ